jgi:hypothetical protein
MRYQVVTYSHDIGIDEKLDFQRKKDAIAHARLYKKREDYAAVYDEKTRTATVVFGNPFTRVFADRVEVVVPL